MAIITSRAVGVDTTANQPAAATANRLYIHTTSGSKLYLHEIDDGSNWQPLRANFAHVIRANFQTGDVWAIPSAASYNSFGGTNQVNLHKLDFTRFRQGRIFARCRCRGINTGASTFKIVDVTNSKDLTNTVSFSNSGSWDSQTSTWLNLDSATYSGGDAIFEAQGQPFADGEVTDVGTLILELR